MEAIKKADREEIVQFFSDLKAVEAMYEKDVEGMAHGCHIFTVDKFLASREFEKSVAALHGITEVAKIDVKGAFIQTPMEGPPVYMRCNPDLTRLIIEIYLELKKYVNERGYLYCKLLEALYGCIQASKLWFNKLVKFLKQDGYEQSPTDPSMIF